ncbi:hypothetical protein [Streptomyces sp. NPDC014733]|uniref:hypothetical protein n=1 Tax=Streptomyces sp. NPDC014733 TaxID=3364885 RepID=UPI0036F81F5B
MNEFERNYSFVHVEADAHPSLSFEGAPTVTIDAAFVVSGYRGWNSWQISLDAAKLLRNSLDAAIASHEPSEE